MDSLSTTREPDQIADPKAHYVAGLRRMILDSEEQESEPDPALFGILEDGGVLGMRPDREVDFDVGSLAASSVVARPSFGSSMRPGGAY